MDLREIDFINDETESFSLSKIALPDELPRPVNGEKIPAEVLRSTTVENLLSQNQDLMNRLSVSLRRLTSLENENQRVVEDNRKTQLQFKGLKDQITVFSEKEKLWKNRLDILETEKSVALEKLRALEARAQELQAKSQRYEKYHEKVRTQVKPYIAELKEFSRQLEERNVSLESEIAHKEALLSDLRSQIIEVTRSSRQQLEIESQKHRELASFYEEQFERQQSEISRLQEISQENELKGVKLQRALERLDHLENQTVELTRSKEELKARLENEIADQATKQQELNRQNQRLGIEHADLQIRVLELEGEKQTLNQENFNLKEQLSSLRYMWTSKNEEAEKLKSALNSLERINVDLATKVNSMRSNQE